MKRTKEYMVWIRIKGKCYNKKNRQYPSYGGRGIKVCSRWRNSFPNFLADVGFAPSKDHSLDRYPNNDGHYEPENFRWATVKEQSNNTRRNRFIKYKGKSKTIAGWAEYLNMNYDTLKDRLDSGWSATKTLTAPLQDKRDNLIPGRKFGAKGKRQLNSTTSLWLKKLNK